MKKLCYVFAALLVCSCSAGVSYEKYDQLGQDYCDCVSKLSGMAEHSTGCKAEYEAWDTEGGRLVEQINEADAGSEIDVFHQHQEDHVKCHEDAIRKLMEKDQAAGL